MRAVCQVIARPAVDHPHRLGHPGHPSGFVWTHPLRRRLIEWIITVEGGARPD